MMKADHVRRLCLCPVCGKLGNERAMIKAGPMGCLAHDRCVFEQLGEGILNLSKRGEGEVHLGRSGAGYDEQAGRRGVSWARKQ